MSRIHANNFVTTIDGAITNSATSVVLTSVTGFPSIGGGITCNLTLQSGSVIEIVTATARSSNTLTITRAAEGTSAVAWANGSSISIRPTADSVDRKLDINDATETAQDAIGAMVDSTLVYTDGTPLLSRAALTGDVTASAGSNSTTIANSAVTLAKMADMATSSLIYRKTAGSGAPEVNTLATLKTDLALTGTNSGDQNIFQTISVSGQSDVVADSTTDTLTLAAGSNVTITTNASTDTITIAASGGVAWSEVTGTSQSAAVNNGYIANNASLVTITLPGTAALGDVVEVVGKGAGLWRLAANTGQTIKMGSSTTTSAGSLTGTSQYDSIAVVCITANTTWAVKGPVSSGFTIA